MKQLIIDDNRVTFTSFVDKDYEPQIVWKHGEHTDTWSSSEALAKASALLLVAGISLSEFSIVRLTLKKRGISPEAADYIQIQRGMIASFAQDRVNLDEQLKPVISYDRQEPLVEINWFKSTRLISICSALDEAGSINIAASLAIFDAECKQRSLP